MSKRRKITCVSCGKEQSTYSSNRQHCHNCLPKCRERHYFESHKQKKEVEEVKE